jgi:hypothetical protein
MSNRPTGALVADDFLCRLVGMALVATCLIASINERMRPPEHARADVRRQAIVYAPDYPPYPVRYASIETP